MSAPCKEFSDLPLMLTAPQLAAALGISRAGAYALMHSKDFPTLRIGKRIMVPKQQMMEWIGRQTDGDEGRG